MQNTKAFLGGMVEQLIPLLAHSSTCCWVFITSRKNMAVNSPWVCMCVVKKCVCVCLCVLFYLLVFASWLCDPDRDEVATKDGWTIMVVNTHADKWLNCYCGVKITSGTCRVALPSWQSASPFSPLWFFLLLITLSLSYKSGWHFKLTFILHRCRLMTPLPWPTADAGDGRKAN